MAFTFTLEDGTGLTAANSYVSLAEADDYFAVDPNATAYLALIDADQEKYLAWASRVLDARTTWAGYKKVETSGLRWPRVGVYDRDRIAVEDDIVPKPVKDATCELARFLMTYNPAQGQGVENLRKIVVDVVEIEYQEGTSQVEWPAFLNEILEPLGQFRSGQGGFAKIRRT